MLNEGFLLVFVLIFIAMIAVIIASYFAWGFGAMRIYEKLGYDRPGWSAFLPIYNTYVMMKTIADAQLSGGMAPNDVKLEGYKDRRRNKALLYLVLYFVIDLLVGMTIEFGWGNAGGDVSMSVDFAQMMTSLVMGTVLAIFWYHAVQKLLTPRVNDDIKSAAVKYGILTTLTLNLLAPHYAKVLTEKSRAKYIEK